MCTDPKQFSRRLKDGSTKTITVPCGKCAECRAKKQSAFAAVSVLEAQNGANLAFLTLTYDPEHLPVAFVDSDDPDSRLIGFTRGSECPSWMSEFWSGDHCKPLVGYDQHFYTPSLFREDFKNFLKRYRQDYYRRNGSRVDLRYSLFGEYGEEKKRPHGHMLVYGLDPKELHYLGKSWNNGHVYLEYVPRFNADGSDAFVKVSRYISKYVSKGDCLPQFVTDGFAQKPRLQSSVRLGVRDFDVGKYRNFTWPVMPVFPSPLD